MIVSKQCFCDESMEKKKKKIINRFQKGKLEHSYGIFLSLHRGQLLDIISGFELMQKIYSDKRDEMVLVGIAPSREAAYELTRLIIETVYEKQKDFDVKRFFYE
ncbi:MAG: hypothetical protein IJA32_07360 [Lachnospiraceae bacterium]|nr:hypothetical protein [Lachnospiraceae bacterium]